MIGPEPMSVALSMFSLLGMKYSPYPGSDT